MEPFGGFNMLVFGDLMQLPPVREKQVFQQPEHLLLAMHFWQLLTLVELKKNMRQHGDTTFIDILDPLRVGELTNNHIASLMDKVNINMDGEFAIERALQIYPTNQQVMITTGKYWSTLEAKALKSSRFEHNINL
ncbi:ATP-dependent DNA helicase PIF1-like [Lycorma delicatula]|uniref:ATP-dependent DNA helicase PIF1-like n=1 Tax=Lycorma delicatula TaxID=130591 RepID=UPI003F518162